MKIGNLLTIVMLNGVKHLGYTYVDVHEILHSVQNDNISEYFCKSIFGRMRYAPTVNWENADIPKI